MSAHFIYRLAAIMMLIPFIAGLNSLEHRSNSSSPPDGPDQSCPFSIQPSEPFTGYAGQLDDGQIRLNGSYGTSKFYFDSEGGITDSRGSGCIVTDYPVSQIQCDVGQKPTKGFSVGAMRQLMYQGNPHFWACPAVGSDWNVYVDPNFYQSKCLPIMLLYSGCLNSGNGTVPPCPATSTIWTTRGLFLKRGLGTDFLDSEVYGNVPKAK
ncbi:hypothetical protein O1611_g9309 [Lasiodiplodia mahajangana]|uniref:Uncharacterized protein n=1 Tax=Lasiodiplodia mahajangana TaxID=1108764 RepID=A0ACC2JAZ4_9PEZI|nr:hypothetical protein O1611_g9309 [Lasiodiplodia mahajangana]